MLVASEIDLKPNIIDYSFCLNRNCGPPPHKATNL